MISTMSSTELIDNINEAREGHHDTIYCTLDQEEALKEYAGSGAIFSSNVDNARIFGLDVQSLPNISFPIVCQKGEVFDLAKDYKNGDV